VAHRRDERDRALGRGAHHDLLVEAPQVLDGPAAAGDDEHIGPWNRAARLQRVEAADGGGDLFGRTFALDLYRPHQHTTGKAVFQPV